MPSKPNKAPSLIIDPTVLGDRLPRDRDSIAAMKEKIKKQEQQFMLPDQAYLENHEAARGGPLQPNDFIRRLRKIAPQLIIEQGGYKNCVRVCVNALDDDPKSETFNQWVKEPLACGFCVDQPLPEFSSIAVDKRGKPTREIRGWRTVLLRLIHTGAVSYSSIKAEFGDPPGQRGKLWMAQLQERRV
jgi:hypothetical protein